MLLSEIAVWRCGRRPKTGSGDDAVKHSGPFQRRGEWLSSYSVLPCISKRIIRIALAKAAGLLMGMGQRFDRHLNGSYGSVAQPNTLLTVQRSYSFHPTSRVVTHRLEGTPAPALVGEFLDTVVSDPDFAAGYNFISDLRDCKDPGCTFLQAFAKEVRARAALIAPCQWAMVVSTQGGVTAVHLLNVLTFGYWVEFAAFLTPEEAVEWVDAGSSEWLAFDDLR